MQTCLKCNTPSDYFFCPACVPSHNSTASFQIFVGYISIIKAAWSYLTGKTIIRWWMGSDVLYLFMFPPGRGKLTMTLHRIRAIITEPMITQHWTDSTELADELRSVPFIDKNKIRVEHHVGKNLKVYPKQRHDGFNVAYYRTNDSIYAKWLFGFDIIEKLKEIFPDFNWIFLDGKKDMAEIFPILDLYVRPNRHDGRSRLKAECELNGIPVVSMRKEPIDLDKLCSEINKIYNAYVSANYERSAGDTDDLPPGRVCADGLNSSTCHI